MKTLLKITLFLIFYINNVHATDRDETVDDRSASPKTLTTVSASNQNTNKDEILQLLPNEIFSKILPYLDDIPLIRINEVCHFFKEEGDRIWVNRILSFSRQHPRQHRNPTGEKFICLLGNPPVMIHFSQVGEYLRMENFLKALQKGERYKKVSLQGVRFIGSNMLDKLSYLTSLKSLNLSATSICGLGEDNDKKLSYFSTFTNLIELDLSDNYIKDAHIDFFKAPVSLKKLNLAGNPLSDHKKEELKSTYKHLELIIEIAPNLFALPILRNNRLNEGVRLDRLHEIFRRGLTVNDLNGPPK